MVDEEAKAVVEGEKFGAVGGGDLRVSGQGRGVKTKVEVAMLMKLQAIGKLYGTMMLKVLPAVEVCSGWVLVW